MRVVQDLNAHLAASCYATLCFHYQAIRALLVVLGLVQVQCAGVAVLQPLVDAERFAACLPCAA